MVACYAAQSPSNTFRLRGRPVSLGSVWSVMPHLNKYVVVPIVERICQNVLEAAQSEVCVLVSVFEKNEEVNQFQGQAGDIRNNQAAYPGEHLLNQRDAASNATC